MWEPCCKIVPSSTYVLGCPCFFTAQASLATGCACLGCISEPDRGIQIHQRNPNTRQSWAVGRLAVLFMCTSGILAAASACPGIISLVLEALRYGEVSSERVSYLWGLSGVVWTLQAARVTVLAQLGCWAPVRGAVLVESLGPCTIGLSTSAWLFLSKPLRNLGCYLQMGLMERNASCSPDFQTHRGLVWVCFLI